MYRNTDMDLQIISVILIIHGIKDISVQNIEVQLYNRGETETFLKAFLHKRKFY